VDIQEEERRRRQHLPKREKHSRAVHGQELQKVQQKRGVDKERLGKPSKC